MMYRYYYIESSRCVVRYDESDPVGPGEVLLKDGTWKPFPKYGLTTLGEEARVEFR